MNVGDMSSLKELLDSYRKTDYTIILTLVAIILVQSFIICFRRPKQITMTIDSKGKTKKI